MRDETSDIEVYKDDDFQNLYGSIGDQNKPICSERRKQLMVNVI